MRQLSLFDLDVFQETSGSASPAPAKMAVSLPPPDRKPPDDPLAAEKFQRALSQLLKVPLRSLVLTNNRSRIISARGASEGMEVRIHRCFVHATPETLKYVAEFVNGARGAARKHALVVIREHFDGHRQATPARRRTTELRPRGRYFDLAKIRDDVNRLYFDSAVDVKITWGRARATHRRRRNQGYSVRLGSYHHTEGLIRIHRSLDGPDVPLYVVESVIHHEMLHAVIPPVVRPGSRRQLHPPEFRRREREYPRYDEAEKWLSDNLAGLASVK